MENLKYINNSRTTVIRNVAGVEFVQSAALNEIDFINHAFSTRAGGVSKGIWKSMNLNFGRGDDENAVRENFRLFAEAIGSDIKNMVYSMQTHTTNVVRVTREDCGNGVILPQKFSDVDGLITNEPGVCLVTTYADCVPLYFVDKAKKAIGLSHSGWRGTVGNMAKATIDMMVKEFGSNPSDITAFIGPSICAGCYEVSENVALIFTQAYDKSEITGILKEKDAAKQKYLLNLHEANLINIKNAGVREADIHITDLCTCCNPAVFFSHRASGGKRGGLCAFLEIKHPA